MTRNQELNIMHVRNASQFLGATRHAVIPGDTLVFDFVFFLHPVRWAVCLEDVWLDGAVGSWRCVEACPLAVHGWLRVPPALLPTPNPRPLPPLLSHATPPPSPLPGADGHRALE